MPHIIRAQQLASGSRIKASKADKMESLPSNVLLEFKPDTLLYIRKQYDLDKPERMDESINILEEWIKKQAHFEMKTFRQDYLERLIIFNKGSIEKCKKKLDGMCTLRTLIPDFFEVSEYNNPGYFKMLDTFLPKMTPDHGRVHLFRGISKKYSTPDISSYYKYIVVASEYLQLHDYCNNVSYVIDLRDGSPLDYAMAININDFRKLMDTVVNTCSMRIKGIHVVSPSKAVDTFYSMLKHLVNKKIGERIYVHTTIESLYEYVPKEILPEEYGGNEKSINELCDKMFEELTSSEFVEYRKEMQQARTNEALRQRDKFNDEYLGFSGTFRNLSVD